jgi:curved DNA-binding protein CbpA
VIPERRCCTSDTFGPQAGNEAEEKFKAVNQAYEAICKERGI